MGSLDGRVAIVTGAGRGLGRAHALMLAGHGAAVVVNDPGVAGDGQGNDAAPAQQVVAEIEKTAGGPRPTSTAARTGRPPKSSSLKPSIRSAGSTSW